MVTKTGKDFCSKCGKLLDAASSVEGEHVPNPGDITVCAYCGEFLLYSDDMKLVELPKVIWNQLDQELKSQLVSVRLAAAKIRDQVRRTEIQKN